MSKDRNIKPKTTASKPPSRKTTQRQAGSKAAGLNMLQRQVGNRAVQQMVQRAADTESQSESVDAGVDENIQDQIDSSGQPLDAELAAELNNSLGHELDDVRIHVGPEANKLTEQLDAKAFTVGQDIFFKSSFYNPNSPEGRELITHEVTHAIDQSEGEVHTDRKGMSVLPAGDAHEQRADNVARQIGAMEPGSVEKTYVAGQGMVARSEGQTAQEASGQVGAIQRDGNDEEPVELKSLQRAEDEDVIEEKSLQRAEDEEVIEEKSLQRAEDEDVIEEKSLQRAEDEEVVEEKSLQRDGNDEEPIELKSLQRAEDQEVIEEKSLQREETPDYLENADAQRKPASDAGLSQTRSQP